MKNFMLQDRNVGTVPCWFMRQAGRYHSHYQNLKKQHTFMELCKTPELACEVTLGPIEDFKFDAAILFSDLLFPLENLGMGLSYESGPPTLEFHLEDRKNLNLISPRTPGNVFYDFQKKSIQLLKQKLPKNKTLLGFVGAPFTLYTYAMEGGHHGNLIESKKGFFDNTFKRFFELLKPEILNSMYAQVTGGADVLCLFDTAVGELCLIDFEKFIVPAIEELLSDFKMKFPHVPICYYSKLTHLDYLRSLPSNHIDILGVDWRVNLPAALREFGNDYYLQGNIDPAWLHLPKEHLQSNLIEFKNRMLPVSDLWHKWIAGLGHGVLQKTPEENVRSTVDFIHDKFVSP
ncbi:MAG: uroporphyrinogen decarboxylase family protein [Bacteriovoracaceae bacterium]|nr:uroporphyrinogen decarboxylase family protein [Bacteriovoracaceae bacterium]